MDHVGKEPVVFVSNSVPELNDSINKTIERKLGYTLHKILKLPDHRHKNTSGINYYPHNLLIHNN